MLFSNPLIELQQSSIMKDNIKHPQCDFPAATFRMMQEVVKEAKGSVGRS